MTLFTLKNVSLNMPAILILIIAALCGLASLLSFRQKWKDLLANLQLNQRLRKRPPGPRPWPLVGNLPALATLPHQSLARLSKAYGPLMYLRLGSVPTFVVSSPEIAKEVLNTHDKVFASRPRVMSCEILGYGSQNFGFLPYGDQWRNLRKLFTTELVTGRRLEGSQTVRRDEVLLMLQSIAEEAKREDGKAGVGIFSQMFRMTTNIVARMTFSKRMFGATSTSNFNSIEFQHCVEAVAGFMGVFNISDFIPSLKRFDPQGFKKPMLAAHKRMDTIFQQLLDGREEEIRRGERKSQIEDFMDVLLTHPIGRTGKPMSHDGIKAMMVDILVAGTDTSAITLEWAVTELVRNPTALHRCQDELHRVVGEDRLVDESDLPDLPYLRAAVKETMRLHPAGALMLPHESTEGCWVGGYFIPRGSRIIVNAWAIGRDPAVWDRACEFDPDRFLPHITSAGVGLDSSAAAEDFGFLAFGAGRRSCAGMKLAVRVVGYALAAFLHAYHVRLPDSIATPADIDMSEEFALGVCKRVPLRVVPTPRLPASLAASIWPATAAA